MGQVKIDLPELWDRLQNGKTPRDCAEYFGVSEAAICKARKKLNSGLPMKQGVSGRSLVVIDQLEKINTEVYRIMADLRKSDDLASKQTLLRATAEIRRQLQFQLEILKSLHDLESVQAFQSEVLEVIGGVSEDIRQEIIEKLKRRRALRRALNVD